MFKRHAMFALHARATLLSTLSCESLAEDQAITPVDDNMSVAGEEDPGAALDTMDLSPNIAFDPHDNGIGPLNEGILLLR